MLVYVAILLLGLGLALYLVRRASGLNLHDNAEAVQAVLTSLAILVAGLWYFTERKSAAHADLSLEVTGAHVSAGLVLIEAKVRTRNLGHVLLETSDWNVQLQSVVPTILPVEEIANLPLDDWRERIGDLNIYWNNQIQWHTLRRFTGQDHRQIEPGELDLKTFDFLIRCDTILARISVALRKPGWGGWLSLRGRGTGETEEGASGNEGGRNAGGETPGSPAEPTEEWWWEDHALLPIAQLCRAPVGSVSNFSAPQRGEGNPDGG